MAGKNKNNPDIYVRMILNDISVIKADLRIIKEKLKFHEKLIYFILSMISALFVKIVFL